MIASVESRYVPRVGDIGQYVEPQPRPLIPARPRLALARNRAFFALKAAMWVFLVVDGGVVGGFLLILSMPVNQL